MKSKEKELTMDEKIAQALKDKDGHKAPVTRREFLALGLTESVGYLMLPSVIELALRPNFAEAAVDCSSINAGAAGGTMMPFLLIDCAGGIGLSGNFTPMGAGGAPLASYGTLAIPDALKAAGGFNSSLGAPFFMANNNANAPDGWDNKIAEGIFATTSLAVRQRTFVGITPVSSTDDSGNNQLNSALLIRKAGAAGSLIPGAIGTGTSAGGGNSTVPPLTGVTPALRVRSLADVQGAVSIGGPGLAGFSAAQKTALVDGISKLNTSQQARLASLKYKDQVNALVECGMIKNKEFTGAVTNLVDPNQNAAFNAIYANAAANVNGATGVAAGTNVNTARGAANLTVEKTVVYNVLQGTSGPGTIQLGGCDYHNNGRVAATNPKDLELGGIIGRALAAAAVLNKPLFISVITDGAVSARAGTREWTADSGVRSAKLTVVFNPAARPQSIRTQIGAYTAGQVVDQTGFIGANPARAAYETVLNYLAANKMVGLFSSVVPENLFPAAQIDNHLFFPRG